MEAGSETALGQGSGRPEALTNLKLWLPLPTLLSATFLMRALPSVPGFLCWWAVLSSPGAIFHKALHDLSISQRHPNPAQPRVISSWTSCVAVALSFPKINEFPFAVPCDILLPIYPQKKDCTSAPSRYSCFIIKPDCFCNINTCSSSFYLNQYGSKQVMTSMQKKYKGLRQSGNSCMDFVEPEGWLCRKHGKLHIFK